MTEPLSPYYDRQAMRDSIAGGAHREVIGGLWEEIGRLQLDFLIREGLLPRHRLLDVGCGSMRGGVQFVRYLESGHYYGLDISRDLIEAGYEREIRPLGLDARLPRENLIDDPDFDFRRFPRGFEYAIAISVFTHLPLDIIRACLERLPEVMAPGARFYASFFEVAADRPTHLSMVHPQGGIQTFAGRDPYHQRFGDFTHLCVGLPWRVEYLGDFGHPRGQRMLRFTRD